MISTDPVLGTRVTIGVKLRVTAPLTRRQKIEAWRGVGKIFSHLLTSVLRFPSSISHLASLNPRLPEDRRRESGDERWVTQNSDDAWKKGWKIQRWCVTRRVKQIWPVPSSAFNVCKHKILALMALNYSWTAWKDASVVSWLLLLSMPSRNYVWFLTGFCLVSYPRA